MPSAPPADASATSGVSLPQALQFRVSGEPAGHSGNADVTQGAASTPPAPVSPPGPLKPRESKPLAQRGSIPDPRTAPQPRLSNETNPVGVTSSGAGPVLSRSVAPSVAFRSPSPDHATPPGDSNGAGQISPGPGPADLGATSLGGRLSGRTSVMLQYTDGGANVSLNAQQGQLSRSWARSTLNSRLQSQRDHVISRERKLRSYMTVKGPDGSEVSV